MFVLLVLIVIGCICYAIKQYCSKNYKGFVRALVGTVLSCVCAIIVGIMTNYSYEVIKPLFPFPDISEYVDTTDNNDDLSVNETEYSPSTTNGNDLSSVAIRDITNETTITDKILEDGQKNSYSYTAMISGTYRFSVDPNAGTDVWLKVCGEDDNIINSGLNTISVDLEMGKTYIFSIEYQNGICDYTVEIGVPSSIRDITGTTNVTGSITYQGQEDKYLYTASIAGTYRFDTNLSSGGSVRIHLYGENGNSIDYGYDALTVELEAGKRYVLSVEYRNGVCDYTVNIGVPLEISDLTGNTSVSGSITYQDQKNRYYYTAPNSGTYRFDTNLSSGGSVRVHIYGENGNSIDYDYDALTIDLEAGKTYILSVEYRNGPCDYVVNIGIPIKIADITGSTSISGNITYKDQKDKYLYTAPVTGTYLFSSNLSSGGSIKVHIYGENGNSLKYNYDELSIDLEAGKTYILSVEFRNATCTYEVFINYP